jgi:hypothetical protein
MAHRIGMVALCDQEGYETIDDLVEEMKYEDLVPAICSDGCQVEQDGICPHGFPSVMLSLGLV